MCGARPNQEMTCLALRRVRKVKAALADQVRLATIMDDAEHDVLASVTFPKEHRAKLHSTTRPTRPINPIERLNGEIKRRTEGRRHLPPNDDAIVRLVGAILLEQNDEWACSGPAT
jgi:putative transposase